MLRLTLCLALLGLHHVTSKSAIGRALTETEPPCDGAGGPLKYFSIGFAFVPGDGFHAGECTESMQTSLTLDINDLLVEYGIGEAGQGDNATVLAEVCDTLSPVEVVPGTRRRLGGYVWRGYATAVCRLCQENNSDGRRRRLSNGDSRWFRRIFLPEFHDMLVNATMETIVGNHVTCLGNNPEVTFDLKPITRAAAASFTC